MSITPYKRGEMVEVFYRMGRDDGCYFPVASQAAVCLRPRFGKSDGWMMACVEEDWPPPPNAANGGGQNSNGRIRVRHTHTAWSNRRGERLDPFDDRDMVVMMGPADVRRPVPDYSPAVSLFVVRWGGEQTPFNNDQWGQASSSVSDDYVDYVLDGTLYPRLGPDYEVITAFVESGADMRKLQASAIGPMLRGRHVCALYFLWPVMAQDGGDVEQSGMVNAVEYFATVRGFEAAGVPTRFPHASQLYETLLAKDWQSALCLNAKFRIPIACTVNRAAVLRSPRKAAAHVIESLAMARELRYAEGGEPDCVRPLEGEVRRGVVKLGYAWEAAHVRVFRGESQLAEAMQGLISTQGVESTSIIVQDYVKNNFEMRCFVVDGRVAHIIYSSFERVDVDGYPRDFVKYERDHAISAWMDGDSAAMDDAEKKAFRLVRHWLTWLRCRSAEPTPCIRMDILVTRAAPGRAEVHTLELTEAGFSMLAWPDGPHTVFNALIESFFNDVEPTPNDAQKLASTRPVGAKASAESSGLLGAGGAGGGKDAPPRKKKKDKQKRHGKDGGGKDGGGKDGGAMSGSESARSFGADSAFSQSAA